MPEMLPCYVFVDGQYVRTELRNWQRDDEFDPTKPATLVRNQRIAARQLGATRVFYYDALDQRAERTERERQQRFFDKVRTLPDTHVVLGEVRKGVKRREQKGVDVQLAVDALRMAMTRTVEAIGLVTGDADFAPLAKAIREAGPHVLVLAFSNSLSATLAREADRVIKLPDDPQDWGLP